MGFESGLVRWCDFDSRSMWIGGSIIWGKLFSHSGDHVWTLTEYCFCRDKYFSRTRCP
jgi:hypothetical protein